MLSSTRHACVWFVHMRGCTIDCTDEDWWIHPLVCEVDRQQPRPTGFPQCVPWVSLQADLVCSSLQELLPNSPASSCHLTNSSCSLAVAISSLFLRSGSSDSEICSFLGLRLLRQPPPTASPPTLVSPSLSASSVSSSLPLFSLPLLCPSHCSTCRPTVCRALQVSPSGAFVSLSLRSPQVTEPQSLSEYAQAWALGPSYSITGLKRSPKACLCGNPWAPGKSS